MMSVEKDAEKPEADIMIQVSSRIRPLLKWEQHSIITLKKDDKGEKNQKIIVQTNNYFNNGERLFLFEQVLGEETSQEQVFNSCAENLCQKFIQGKNCNIILYGPTSTGKTYTMEGPIKIQNPLNSKTNKLRSPKYSSISFQFAQQVHKKSISTSYPSTTRCQRNMQFQKSAQ